MIARGMRQMGIGGSCVSAPASFLVCAYRAHGCGALRMRIGGIIRSRWLGLVVSWSVIVAVIATGCEPAPGLSSWKELRPAAVGLSDGRLAVFRTNTAGRVDYRVQETPMVGATG